MTLGFFPGCSMHGTALEYGESLHAVAKAFGITLKEIEDWNCCGATAAHSLNHLLSVALPARTLALAEQQGYDEVIVPCAACYARLASARHEFLNNDDVRKELPGILEMPFEGRAVPISIIDFLEKYIFPNMQDKVKKQFAKKVACYYGCLLVRPPKIAKVDNYEDPQMMESMMKKIGATPIDWAFKVECCGAGLSIPRTDIVAKLSGKIVGDAVDRGADAIVVACPMCQSNLDMRRPEINEYLGKTETVPVMFITQVIGLAMGLSEKELGLQRLFTSARPVMNFDKQANQQEKKQPEKVEA